MFSFIIIIIVIIVFLNFRKESPIPSQPQNSSENSELSMNKINYSQYYKPKRYVITLNELNFYNVLMEVSKELDLILFSQVSLYNILETKNNLDYSTKTKYFNKIAAKSIDFVLVDKKIVGLNYA